MNLSQEQIDEFQTNGAICLRNVFSSEWVDKIKRGIERSLDNPSQYSEFLRERPDQGAYFNDYFNWKSIPEFHDYVYKSPAARLVQHLIQSSSVTFYHEHVLVKEQGATKETPWHHDQSYYPFDGDKVCSIWMPVDPIPLETTLKFLRGSHKWGWFYPRKFATSLNYPLTAEDSVLDHDYKTVPDVTTTSDADILQWTLQPGDCIVFHMRALHGASGNTTSQPRRILSTRWFGDDACLANRPWTPSPPIVGSLKTGDWPGNDPDTFPIIISPDLASKQKSQN